MLMFSILLYGVVLYLTFKYIKNDWVEILILIGVSIACKFMIGDSSFYPLFAMPVLLALRHNKPYSIVYTLVMVTLVNIFAGFGIWTLGQYLIYGVISLGTYFVRKNLNKQNKVVVFAYSFVSMFMFGVLMDVFIFYAGNMFGFSSVFEQVIAGIPFSLRFGLSGLIYGGLSLTIAYIASINVKDVLKVKNMRLEKVRYIYET